MDNPVSELASLKLSLAPIFKLIDEIKSLKKSHRISEESSLTTVGLLTLEIKEDVIATVRALQIDDEKRMNGLELAIKDSQKESRDKIKSLSQSASNLELDVQNMGDLIARQNSFIENQNKNIDGLKKDLLEKAHISEIADIQKKFKKFTPLSEFFSLANQIQELATKATVDIIKKDLGSIEKRVKSYVTSEEVDSAFQKSMELAKEEIKLAYVSRAIFEEERQFTVKRCDRIEEELPILYQKFEALSNQMKKKTQEIMDYVKKKPWADDVNFLQTQVNECSNKNEFKELKKFVEPKIVGFSKIIEDFNGKVTSFEKILERYDEIILDKASKVDISLINQKILTLTPLEVNTKLKDEVLKEREATSSRFALLGSKSDELNAAITVLSQRIEMIKRENIEASMISNSLAIINDKIAEKADKSDIFLIYDVMGKKDEVKIMRENEAQLKKQLETSVVILQSLCRTLLKGGEPPSVTSKQRFDLYRNLSTLLTWINGDDPREAQVSMIIKNSFVMKSDQETETYTDLLASSRLKKRFKRNIMTTSPRTKTSADFANLPRIS